MHRDNAWEDEPRSRERVGRMSICWIDPDGGFRECVKPEKTREKCHISEEVSRIPSPL
jgi:hypothetical protein